MLQLTPHHRILLAVSPVDFRVGIDGLQALCRRLLAEDPLKEGSYFSETDSGNAALTNKPQAEQRNFSILYSVTLAMGWPMT